MLVLLGFTFHVCNGCKQKSVKPSQNSSKRSPRAAEVDHAAVVLLMVPAVEAAHVERNTPNISQRPNVKANTTAPDILWNFCAKWNATIPLQMINCHTIMYSILSSLDLSSGLLLFKYTATTPPSNTKFCDNVSCGPNWATLSIIRYNNYVSDFIFLMIVTFGRGRQLDCSRCHFHL